MDSSLGVLEGGVEGMLQCRAVNPLLQMHSTSVEGELIRKDEGSNTEKSFSSDKAEG